MTDYKSIKIAKWVLDDKSPRIILGYVKLWRERMEAARVPNVGAQPYKFRHAQKRHSEWSKKLPCPEAELPTVEQARETLLNGWQC